MFNPKLILVPTDFSECDGSCSMMAVKKAISLSKQFGSQLIFLHVISEDPYRKPMFFLADDKIDLIIKKMKEASYDQLNKIVEDFASDIKDKCKILIRTGKPAIEILKEAEESKTDLIVIATCGLGDVHTAIFGSTTDKVIRHAKCSVLVSRKPNNN
ncbi:MAG: universal stress protein [Bacteroidetes bacterium]|nr:universal stress protein [Bacteroidota bacterium]MBU1113910.1 universal stress protein [Bacteroidota bacterium]MBU1798229.1 universal stress protein [Bacteroidota bacterium]